MIYTEAFSAVFALGNSGAVMLSCDSQRLERYAEMRDDSEIAEELGLLQSIGAKRKFPNGVYRIDGFMVSDIDVDTGVQDHEFQSITITTILSAKDL